MLKSIRWKSFPRDFVVIQIGFALFGLSIALMIRANLGTGSWSVLDVALAQIAGWTPGTLTVLVGFTVLVIAMLLREQVGWGTLGNILSIGPWEDLFLWLIPSVQGNLPLQTGMLLASVATQGLASAIYIGVNAGAGPRDSLMLAVHRTTRLSLRLARGSIEVGVLLIGWSLGGPAGIGTAVIAILIGPAVQWGFRLFNVHPHRPEAPLPAEAEAAAD
jgi:uncharacterized membrane protein YczE